MNREQLFDTVSEIIVRLFETPKASIFLESRLFEDLDLDSIDAVDLAAQLQEHTGRRIHPSEFKQVRTVKDVVEAAHSILQEENKARGGSEKSN